MAMACGSCSTLRHTLSLTGFNSQLPLSSSSSSLIHFSNSHRSSCVLLITRHIHNLTPEVPVLVARASPGNGGATDGDDGVSLGTMKQPLDIDFQRFDSLLFRTPQIPSPFKPSIFTGNTNRQFTLSRVSFLKPRITLCSSSKDVDKTPSAEFIEMRRQALDLFVNRIASHHELQQSEDLRLFLQAEEETMERLRAQETGIFKKPSDLMQIFKVRSDLLLL
ncbi:hypothetical protein PIB30_025859 [Stylosanthes scabra]|uniref:PX domain-containing protein n=1 Tax=Stylosanthes scabra TaxID=79078 RepID=A0ABU6WAE9_9FABA|nr:hypothetical protein [Stylosanthes scabra]